jgi:hypothetical protein
MSRDRAVGDLDALAVQLLPDLLVAVATVEAFIVDAADLTLEHLVAHLACTRRPGLGAVVRRRGELQGSADRLDPPSSPSGIDVTNYLLV